MAELLAMPKVVVAGACPGNPRALPPVRQQDVDARDKRGHDEVDGPPLS
jgi:hypothetical protein